MRTSAVLGMQHGNHSVTQEHGHRSVTQGAWSMHTANGPGVPHMHLWYNASISSTCTARAHAPPVNTCLGRVAFVNTPTSCRKQKTKTKSQAHCNISSDMPLHTLHHTVWKKSSSIMTSINTRKPSLLHTLTRACLGGALVYSVVDQASDLSTFFIVKQLAIQIAQRNQQLRDQLGTEDAALHTSPWYDSSIRFSHDGHICNAVFALHGSKMSTDIQVQVGR